MTLDRDLERIAGAARAYAAEGEALAAVIPTEPVGGVRVYLCAFGEEGEDKSWLALDEEGRPIRSRETIRDAVSIAALCEVAEDVAGGGSLERLRAELVSIRLTENPPGIEEAEEAALALERVVGVTPRLATPSHLDEVGGATRRLEQSLGEVGRSPFTETMKSAVETVDELIRDVEGHYKLELG